MAVGDEGAHAERLGERQGLAVVGLAALGVERGRDGVAMSPSRCSAWASTRLVPERIRLRGRPDAAPRRAGRAADARAQRVVGPAAMSRIPRCETLESCSPSRSRSALARFAKLSQAQAEEATAMGRPRTTFPSGHLDPVLEQAARPAPSRPCGR